MSWTRADEIKPNQLFGVLTTQKRVGKSRWVCSCRCGGTRIVEAWRLLHFNLQSCGGCKYRGALRIDEVRFAEMYLSGVKMAVIQHRLKVTLSALKGCRKRLNLPARAPGRKPEEPNDKAPDHTRRVQTVA